MKKKLSIMLVLVLVLSLISFYVPTNAEEKPTVSADDEAGSVGEEITIPVRITGNSKLASFAISVSYDDEVLTPVSVEKGDLIPTGNAGGNFGDNIFPDKSDTSKINNPFMIRWQGNDNAVGDGILFEMKFKILDTANAGNTTVKLIPSDDEGDFFYVDDEGELTCVALSFQDTATVTIEDNNSGTEPKETDNPTEPVESGSPTEPEKPTETDVTGKQVITLNSDDTILAERGKEVSIPLYLQNGDKVDMVSFIFVYDADAVENISISPGKWYEEENDSFNSDVSEDTESPFIYVSASKNDYDNPDNMNFGKSSEPFAYMKCKIKDNTALGKNSKLFVFNDEDYLYAAKWVDGEVDSDSFLLKCKPIIVTIVDSGSSDDLAEDEEIVSASPSPSSDTENHSGASENDNKPGSDQPAPTIVPQTPGSNSTSSSGNQNSGTTSGSDNTSTNSNTSANNNTSTNSNTSANNNSNISNSSSQTNYSAAKKNQTIKVTGKTKKIKASKLKKKAQIFRISVYSSTYTYKCKKVSGSSKLKISKAGKVTVKKKTKKGTYKMKVLVSASGDSIYKSAKKNVTIKVVVK